MLPPLTPSTFVARWQADPAVLVGLGVLLVGYVAAMRRARRLGTGWPAYRLLLWVVAGLGSIAVATLSSFAVYGRVLMWPAAVQVTLLVAVVPVGLALGDPLGLARAALGPAGRARWDRTMSSRPLRVLTFPLVGAVLAVVTQLVVVTSGYLGAAERHRAVMDLLDLQLLATGSLFALPLLGVEVLPAWMTQPLRMAFAAVDGLLDALPGIVVMTAGSLVAGGYYGTVSRTWGPTPRGDQQLGGGLMLTLSEVVAVPFIVWLYRAWIREDAAHARVLDRRLDAEAAAAAPVTRQVADGTVTDTLTTRPWWETDPGPLADRAQRYGWNEDPPAGS